MSGKKSWEVAEVLSQSEDVQRKIIKAVDEKIKNYFSKIEKLDKEINELKNKINSYKINANLSKKEFKKEMEELQNKIDFLKRKKYLNTNFEGLQKTRENILKELEKENQKASRIREKIKNATHYVTSEYNEAVKIRDKINKLKDKFSELEKLSKLELDKFTENLNKVSSIDKEIRTILNEVDRLEKKAKEIKEIRTKNKKMIEEIKKEFDRINISIADKFLKNEFEILTNKVEEFLKKTRDRSFINIKNMEEFNELFNELVSFKNKLSSKYNEYLTQKKNLEDNLKSLKELNKKEYVLVEDFLSRKDRKVTKLNYYDHYNQTNYEKQFNEMLNEIKTLIDKDKFKEAKTKLKEVNDLYFTISKATDRLQESIETSLFLTIKIRDIMLDKIDFRKAKVEWVEDKDHKQGFKMICENGDTIIFEKIVVENGKPIIKIDHIEKTPGTCNIRWKDLRDVFANEGIPLIDVTKDGRSVIYGGAREKIIKSNKEKRKAR